MIVTGTGLLVLFAVLASRKSLVEFATNQTKTLPPLPANPGGRDGSVKAAGTCSMPFCASGGASNVPSVIAPLKDFGLRESKTAMTEPGASAVLDDPYGDPGVSTDVGGACENGSVIELAPTFWR